MPSRRDFVRTFAGATAGAYVMSRGVGGHLSALQAPAARRQVTIGGKTIRVIDIHCHCVIDVTDIVKGTPLEKEGGGGGNQVLGRNVFSSWTRPASTYRR